MASLRRFFVSYILMLTLVFVTIFVFSLRQEQFQESFRKRADECKPKILGYSKVKEGSLYKIDVNVTNEGDKGGEVLVSANIQTTARGYYYYDHATIFLKPNEQRSVTLFLVEGLEYTIEVEIMSATLKPHACVVF